ncbi:Hsp20/alpha crystallin family protein [Paenibacillus hamazuiensis]|uniref:Hsp20/alpha crystallin family protein n=1 Tax=Paenibacillus hamazuiensis TaxID=2936508 RepID=UPI00200E5DFD|nr:Hsp20/alpha crystallin family protein [Paenibacillus hamazuiensis]
MDPEKISKWMDIAKQFAGGDFWTDIFEQPASKKTEGKPPADEHPQEAWPRVDILCQQQDLLILIDLPGIAKEDVELSLAGELLHIKGTAKPLIPDASPLVSERPSGPFQRTVRLPGKVDPGTVRITASFHSGVLIIRIPAAAAMRTSIPID